jgi:hypothetical protein
MQLTLISLIQDSHLQPNHAVEIIGKVQNDLSVRVMASTDLGPESGIGEFFLDEWKGSLYVVTNPLTDL